MLETLLRVCLSLGIVLVLLWVVARAGSRRLGAGAGRAVRVLGRQAVGRNASVAVVEVGERVLVVGVGEGGVRLLTEMDPTELPVPERSPFGGSLADGRDAPAPAPAPAGGGVAARTGGGSDGLSGSVLSAQTWRQAWAAVMPGSGDRG